MRSALTVTFAAAVAFGITVSVPASATTIAEAVETAISTHPEVKRDAARMRAAEHRVGEFFAGYLPRIDLEAASGIEVTNSPTTRTQLRDPDGTQELVRSEANASFTQMLFDGFATPNLVASSEASLLARRADLLATAESVALAAATAYLGVLRTRRIVELAEGNVADHVDITGRIDAQLRAGRAAQSNLDQANSRLALARTVLVEAQGDLREARARYTEVVGQPPQGLVVPMEPSYPQADDVEAAISVAMARNPVVLASTAQWNARKADVEVERASYAPRIDLEVTGGVADNVDGVEGYREELQAMVRLRWNLFDGLGDQARVQAATYRSFAANKIDSEARRLVRESVRIANKTLLTAIDRLVPLRDDSDASRRVALAYSEQYDIGQRSLLDLLDSRNESFEADADLVEGEFQVLQTHYELLFGMGLLLETFDVRLFTPEIRDGLPQKTTLASATSTEPVNLDPAQLAALGEWSDFGTWLGEEPASAPEQAGAGPIEAAALLSANVVPAAGDAVPEIIVEPLPPVRALHQIEEIVVEEAPAVAPVMEALVEVTVPSAPPVVAVSPSKSSGALAQLPE